MKWICATIAVNRNLSNCEVARKKKRFFGTSTGFVPVAPAFALQCTTSWAMKTHTLEAGQFIEFIKPWKEWNTEWLRVCVHRIIHHCFKLILETGIFTKISKTTKSVCIKRWIVMYIFYLAIQPFYFIFVVLVFALSRWKWINIKYNK